MKIKPSFSIFFVGFFLFCPLEFKAADFAMDDKTLREVENLNEKEFHLDQVIGSLSDKAETDLLGKSSDIYPWRRFLDQWARDIRYVLKKRQDPERVIQALNMTLFGRYQFQVDRSPLSEHPIETLLIHSVIQTRKGNCLTLSLIYLFLSDRLGFPVEAMMVPEHFFLRTRGPEGHRNIESTSYGMRFRDKYYQKHFRRGPQLSEPRALTRKQVVAVYLSCLANHYKYHGYYERAVVMLETAIRIMPDGPGFLTHLGNAQERSGQIAKAQICYEKALSLDPDAAEAYYNLGLLHFVYTGRYDLALKYGRTARNLGFKLDPKYLEFLENPEAVKNIKSKL